jgi:phage baseplate assembly protein W
MFLHKHFMGALDDEEADIERNLQLVLSSKRGCGYFREDFGLSDTAFRTAEEVVETLTREIKKNIEEYEPRVSVVRIREAYDDDGLKVRLEVVLARRSNGGQMCMAMDLRQRRTTFPRE